MLTSKEPQGAGAILVVDDEVLIVKHITSTLTKKGYTVFGAPDGAAALKVLKLNPDIQLLISDVVMPGLNGRQLLEAIQKLRPDIKAIFMSGYPEEVIAEHGVVPSEIAFLEKPFDNQVLCQKVAAQLAAGTELR